MQLKSQVEWALHCCGILAAVSEGHYLSTKALAEFHGIPKEYLSKALQSLSQAGIVESTLGPSGGYRLAKPPDQITFLNVVEAVEGKASTFVCTEIRQNNPCRPTGFCDTHACGIARVMWEADRAWRQKLESVLLSDLIAGLKQEIPSETLQKMSDWIGERS